MHPYVYCSIIYNSRDLDALQVPTSRQVEKNLWHIYTMEGYLAVKKDGTLTFWNNMDGHGEYYA